MSFLAWPDTEHPAYTTQAKFVRKLMADRRNAIQLPKPPLPISWNTEPDPSDPTLDTWILTVKQAWAQAPYVGRPYVYVWDAAVDDYGRWVAGPSRIQHIPEDPMT